MRKVQSEQIYRSLLELPCLPERLPEVRSDLNSAQSDRSNQYFARALWFFGPTRVPNTHRIGASDRATRFTARNSKSHDTAASGGDILVIRRTVPRTACRGRRWNPKEHAWCRVVFVVLKIRFNDTIIVLLRCEAQHPCNLDTSFAICRPNSHWRSSGV